MTPHVSPGQDCTINPIVIDDSKRSAPLNARAVTLYITKDGAIHFDPSEPELMKKFIMNNIEVQMPIPPIGEHP